MVAQEGTIADVGTPEQVIFDFGEVVRPLALIDVDHPLIGDLDVWRDIMIDIIADVPPQVQLEDAPVGMVSTVLAFIAAMNRPMLLARFGIYAGPILTEQEFEEYVTHPQIRYDFDQLERLTDDPDVIGVIQRYYALCLEGEHLEDCEVVSQPVLDLFRGMGGRPLLQERLHSYFMNLLPPMGVGVLVADPSLPASTQPSITGGLSATLLDPPAV